MGSGIANMMEHMMRGIFRFIVICVILTTLYKGSHSSPDPLSRRSSTDLTQDPLQPLYHRMPVPISLSNFALGSPIAPYPSTFPAPPSLPINFITPEQPIPITAPPHTDLWKKPGLPKASKFPFYHTTLDLIDFHSASVTFHANWTTLYDQGGIAILFPPEHHHLGQSHSEEDHPSRWIKAGVEYVDDAPHFSIVVANKGSWADWTLAGAVGGDRPEYESVTLEMVREGPSLFINIVKGEKKSTVREITWVFEKGLLKENPEVKVGAYVAKPTPEKEGDETGIPVVFTAVEVLKN